MKKATFLLLILLLSGCADVSPQMLDCAPSDPYGFWGGLWHGIISPLAFFGSLFFDSIAFYAINNTGGWYDFGFCLGAGIIFGGSSVTVTKK